LNAIANYAEAVREADTQLGKPKVVILPGDRMIINDGSHGPHDEEHPDDGAISPMALRFAEKLKEYGIESNVKRLD